MWDLLGRASALRVDCRGVTALEYGLIAALMSAALVSVYTTLGLNLGATFSKIGVSLQIAK